MAAKALRLLLLAQTPRTAEIINARWGEVQGDVLVVPGQRVKTKAALKSRAQHILPLSRAAQSLLVEVRPAEIRNDDFIFPGRLGHWTGNPPRWVAFRGGLREDAMQELLRSMGLQWHVHGLRSTFRGWQQDHHPELSDAGRHALGHKVGTKVDGAYDRVTQLEVRRMMAEEWAEFLGATHDLEPSLRS